MSIVSAKISLVVLIVAILYSTLSASKSQAIAYSYSGNPLLQGTYLYLITGCSMKGGKKNKLCHITAISCTPAGDTMSWFIFSFTQSIDYESYV